MDIDVYIQAGDDGIFQGLLQGSCGTFTSNNTCTTRNNKWYCIYYWCDYAKAGFCIYSSITYDIDLQSI